MTTTPPLDQENDTAQAAIQRTHRIRASAIAPLRRGRTPARREP